MINVGVIGYGYWGPNLVRNFNETDGVNVVWVADLNEDSVSFKSINANAIIISSSPDFSNPRYVEVEDNLSLNLKPGTYYWKASNDLLNGFGRSFVVESEVGLDIEDDELTNTGNVILNITETEGGFLVGHIILGPDESSEIENKNDGEYVGRQK